MKKIFTILGAMAAMIVSAQTNLVTNGGFENGLAPWAAGTGSGYTAPDISSDAHSGSSSASYVATATTGFYQNVPVTGSKTYVISFWYKVSAASGARIWSVYKNAGGTAVYTTADASTDQFRNLNKYLDPAAAWTQVTVEMPAPADATSLDVAFRAYGGKTSFFDDVKAYDKNDMAVADFSKDKYSLVKNTVVKETISFAKDANIQIINTAGQVVKTANVAAGSALNVSSLAKGVYFVTGSVNGEKVSQKIIKE